jgi:hypothetical protein
VPPALTAALAGIREMDKKREVLVRKQLASYSSY